MGNASIETDLKSEKGRRPSEITPALNWCKTVMTRQFTAM